MCLDRDPLSAVGAAEMSGAADGGASAASPGPAGFLPQEVRDRERILAQPREAGRALHGQNTQHQGPPAVQVSRADRRGAALTEKLTRAAKTNR